MSSSLDLNVSLTGKYWINCCIFCIISSFHLFRSLNLHQRLFYFGVNIAAIGKIELVSIKLIIVFKLLNKFNLILSQNWSLGSLLNSFNRPRYRGKTYLIEKLSDCIKVVALAKSSKKLINSFSNLLWFTVITVSTPKISFNLSSVNLTNDFTMLNCQFQLFDYVGSKTRLLVQGVL